MNSSFGRSGSPFGPLTAGVVSGDAPDARQEESGYRVLRGLAE